MNWTRVALMVSLAWIAANLLRKIGRGDPGDRDDGLGPLPSLDPGLPVRVRALTEPAGSLLGAARRGPGFARRA
ncbi:MAG TPA: hypothetical protein VLD35_07275 [Caldimonas sp.]|nr:hypothetical protein [Caldimonas sp.]